ncbi:hypothetical protein J7L48_07370 [bacterium]|nr:hypothetical protein [bacterium]
MKKFLLVLTLLFFASSVFALSNFDKHISNAKIYYDTGEFDQVINELKEALNIVKKNNQKGMVEAYKYLAFSYVAYGSVDKAKNYFIEILKIDDSFALDRDMTSPKILTVFDQARVELKKIQKEEKKKEALAKAKTNANTKSQNSYYVPQKKEEKKIVKEPAKVEVKKEKVVKEKTKKSTSYDFGYSKSPKKEKKVKPEKKEKPKPPKVKKEKKSTSYDFGYGTKKKKEKLEKKKSEKGKSDLVKTTNPVKNTYIPPKKLSPPPHGRNYRQTTKFNAAWRSFLIPGWGQLYKGQKAKGYIFISTTLLLDLFYVLNTSAVNSTYDDYEAYKGYNADYETEYWDYYDKAYNKYQLFGLIHLLFWTYNMTDASFFGWKKINMSMDVNKKGTFMLTLKKEF